MRRQFFKFNLRRSKLSRNAVKCDLFLYAYESLNKYRQNQTEHILSSIKFTNTYKY